MAHDLRGFPKTTLQLPELSSQWLLLSNSLVDPHRGGAQIAQQMAEIAVGFEPQKSSKHQLEQPS